MVDRMTRSPDQEDSMKNPMDVIAAEAVRLFPGDKYDDPDHDPNAVDRRNWAAGAAFTLGLVQAVELPEPGLLRRTIDQAIYEDFHSGKADSWAAAGKARDAVLALLSGDSNTDRA